MSTRQIKPLAEFNAKELVETTSPGVDRGRLHVSALGKLSAHWLSLVCQYFQAQCLKVAYFAALTESYRVHSVVAGVDKTIDAKRSLLPSQSLSGKSIPGSGLPHARRTPRQRKSPGRKPTRAGSSTKRPFPQYRKSLRTSVTLTPEHLRESTCQRKTTAQRQNGPSLPHWVAPKPPLNASCLHAPIRQGCRQLLCAKIPELAAQQSSKELELKLVNWAMNQDKDASLVAQVDHALHTAQKHQMFLSALRKQPSKPVSYPTAHAPNSAVQSSSSGSPSLQRFTKNTKSDKPKMAIATAQKTGAFTNSVGG